VLRAARQWLDSNHGQRVFVFVHLYDLHTPYTLPVEAARARGISRYDAQLEYVDQVLGRFQQALEESGWWQKSLVVLLSDHGFFIYESTLWVPLILHWPAGVTNYPAVAPLPAGLIDVAPTILDFLRLPAPRSFAGASLLGTIKAGGAGGPRAVYSESLYAHDAFRWAPLRAWRAGKYKFIQAPHPELYDLQADPHELTNLVQKNSALATELQNELKQLLARYAPQTPAPPAGLSPETLAHLESLGYLAAEPRGAGASSGPDPKDRLPEYESYQTALFALEEGRAGSALPQFRKILRADPQNTLARFHLGECYLKTHQPEDALREWTTTLKLDPAYAPAAEALGQYWLEQGNYAQARLRFQQTLALAPDSYTGHFELGIAAAHLGLLPEARQHFEAACRIAPHSAECARELEALEQRMKSE
jgi:tetratricopeptide (TPR) repeat protein